VATANTVAAPGPSAGSPDAGNGTGTVPAGAPHPIPATP
jgi:hypothetical protein